MAVVLKLYVLCMVLGCFFSCHLVHSLGFASYVLREKIFDNQSSTVFLCAMIICPSIKRAAQVDSFIALIVYNHK